MIFSHKVGRMGYREAIMGYCSLLGSLQGQTHAHTSLKLSKSSTIPDLYFSLSRFPLISLSKQDMSLLLSLVHCNSSVYLMFAQLYPRTNFHSYFTSTLLKLLPYLTSWSTTHSVNEPCNQFPQRRRQRQIKKDMVTDSICDQFGPRLPVSPWKMMFRGSLTFLRDTGINKMPLCLLCELHT